MIDKMIQVRIDGGEWVDFDVVETQEEAEIFELRIKMGSHAISGGQHVAEYRVKPLKGA